jgi:hypothetical protein
MVSRPGNPKANDKLYIVTPSYVFIKRKKAPTNNEGLRGAAPFWSAAA